MRARAPHDLFVAIMFPNLAQLPCIPVPPLQMWWGKATRHPQIILKMQDPDQKGGDDSDETIIVPESTKAVELEDGVLSFTDANTGCVLRVQLPGPEDAVSSSRSAVVADPKHFAVMSRRVCMDFTRYWDENCWHPRWGRDGPPEPSSRLTMIAHRWDYDPPAQAKPQHPSPAPIVATGSVLASPTASVTVTTASSASPVPPAQRSTEAAQHHRSGSISGSSYYSGQAQDVRVAQKQVQQLQYAQGQASAADRNQQQLRAAAVPFDPSSAPELPAAAGHDGEAQPQRSTTSAHGVQPVYAFQPHHDAAYAQQQRQQMMPMPPMMFQMPVSALGGPGGHPGAQTAQAPNGATLVMVPIEALGPQGAYIAAAHAAQQHQAQQAAAGGGGISFTPMQHFQMQQQAHMAAAAMMGAQMQVPMHQLQQHAQMMPITGGSPQHQQQYAYPMNSSSDYSGYGAPQQHHQQYRQPHSRQHQHHHQQPSIPSTGDASASTPSTPGARS